MLPLLLAKQVRKGSITTHGNLLFTRDSENNIRCLPRECPHMGFDLACGKLFDDVVNCPYHHWNFEFGYPEQNNIIEINGVLFYMSKPPNLLEWTSWIHKLEPNKWRHFNIKCHWKHLLSNLCDYNHFASLHGNFWSGGAGLSNAKIVEHFNFPTPYMKVEWQTSLHRPMSSQVWLFLDQYTVVSRVPFGDSYLTNVSLVVPKKDNTAQLITNFFFDSDFYNTSPVIRWWANRIVDVLAFEDKWVLERLVCDEKPQLKNEHNPLVKKIYE